jgi:hypothetical protein
MGLNFDLDTVFDLSTPELPGSIGLNEDTSFGVDAPSWVNPIEGTARSTSSLHSETILPIPKEKSGTWNGVHCCHGFIYPLLN